ncbi:MAG TPA: hypothetical protein VII92_08110 [Anaerolineae bacterium]
MSTLFELNDHHDQIVAMLDQHKSIRFIAFLLECSLADLRQYIKDVLEYEITPEPTKQYPVPSAHTWQPWHRVVIEVQLREDGSDARIG